VITHKRPGAATEGSILRIAASAPSKARALAAKLLGDETQAVCPSGRAEVKRGTRNRGRESCVRPWT